MIALVRDRQTELRTLCALYNVRRLALFGSAARQEDFQPESSDLDFLVKFAPSEADRPASRFFGLLANLERLFNRSVDLVDIAAIRNRYLERAVIADEESLYATA